MTTADDDDDFGYKPFYKRPGAMALAAVVQIAVLAVFVRALAPEFTAKATNAVLATFSVTVTTPPPKPEPAKQPKPAGGSGEVGKKAVPRAVKAEKPKIAIAKTPAPRASSSGSADTSGARDTGSGTGAGGSGTGTGSGAGGSGQGGGAVTKAVHVSGQINNARDFPVPEGGREARIGKAVILALTVSPDGRASGCRVYKSSGLPETDQITCRLAKDRLRFKPATNAAGAPVTSTFYWQQKFFF